MSTTDQLVGLAALAILALCGVLPIVGHVLALRNKGDCDASLD